MNYFQLWKYYGTKNFIGKAWEKVIVDANRYKDPVITQSSVDRSAISNQKSLLKMTSSDRLPSVCYLIHYFFPDKTGGTERFVLNLAMEHKKHGGFVRVLTLSVQPKKHYSHCSNGILWRDYEIEGIPVTEF